VAPGTGALHRGEEGASLIEVVMALVLLATVLIALAGLMFQVARNTRQSAVAGYRSAAATSAAAWIHGLPWDSLGSAVGCSSQLSGSLSYDRCVTVADVSARYKRVTVVIVPTDPVTLRPDTVVIDRTRPRTASVLNVS
jgi:hypothetical protein